MQTIALIDCQLSMDTFLDLSPEEVMLCWGRKQVLDDNALRNQLSLFRPIYAFFGYKIPDPQSQIIATEKQKRANAAIILGNFQSYNSRVESSWQRQQESMRDLGSKLGVELTIPKHRPPVMSDEVRIKLETEAKENARRARIALGLEDTGR